VALSTLLMCAGLALLIRLGSVLLPRLTGRFNLSSAGVLKALLFTSSVLLVYWLQPASPVRYLDFWFPTLTLALIALSWLVTAPSGALQLRLNKAALAGLLGLVLLTAATRFLSPDGLLTASAPPPFEQVLLAVLLAALLGFGLFKAGSKGWLLPSAVTVILLLFAILKIPALAALTASALRALMGQSTTLAAASDLRWLGFSYIAFRLLHTLRDRQNGRLPQVDLAEYLIYVVFFPALSAGPIDRIERFIKDLRRPLDLKADDFAAAGERLAIGMFKKFVLADSLALMALTPSNALQIRTPGWMWITLYAYAFQIYFDFSGYTDIAIGLGRLMGIRLPENFNQPYLKANLTLFWNNWHMSLTQWFRAYFFNPLTRSLRSAKKPLPQPVILVMVQTATFLLIGLWHGVTWNFVIWGLWQGAGLFVQNRWSGWVAPYLAHLNNRPRLKTLYNAASVVLTFHYIALGWVWFALPEPAAALAVLSRLFGLR
jgi:D-alanyl-lipoteichoic acid acyltransferase DltB (MBOAT superfamily)